MQPCKSCATADFADREIPGICMKCGVQPCRQEWRDFPVPREFRPGLPGLRPGFPEITMTRSHKIIGFLFVAMLGLYGCARGSSAGSANDRAALEAKVQRLEEDFRAAAAT